MSDFRIREANSADADDIFTIQKVSWLDTYPNLKHDISKKDIQEKIDTFTIERWKQTLNSKDNLKVWVAEHNQKIVGFGIAKKESENNRFDAIYVHSSHHGRGIGKALAKNILDWLGRDKDILVEVVKYNQKAINFYKKLGFIEYREHKSEHAQLPSGKSMPEIEMIKEAYPQ